MTAPASTQPLRWVLTPPPEPEQVRDLAAVLNLPEPLAALLIQRGFGEPEAAKRFLRPVLSDLADPGSLAGMSEAVELVVETVRTGGTILVHGDYDVDGQCASAILTRALRHGGASVVTFLPHRLRD